MGELFERDGTCEFCGEPLYTDAFMGTHCGCSRPRPATWLPNDDTHAPAPDLTHFDTMCTYEGPDVDPETGCLHEGRQVVDGMLVCDHHAAAAGLDWLGGGVPPRPEPDALTVALEEAHAIDPEQLKAMRVRIAERLGLRPGKAGER